MEKIKEKAQELLLQIEQDVFLFLAKKPKEKIFSIEDISKELSKDNIENQIDDEIIKYVIENLIHDKLVIKNGEGKWPYFKISSIGREIAKGLDENEKINKNKINEIINTKLQDLLPIETSSINVMFVNEKQWNILKKHIDSDRKQDLSTNIVINNTNTIYFPRHNMMFVKQS